MALEQRLVCGSILLETKVEKILRDGANTAILKVCAGDLPALQRETMIAGDCEANLADRGQRPSLPLPHVSYACKLQKD